MTEQKKRILESVNYIKKNSPFKTNPSLAIITYKDPFFLREFSIVKKINYRDIPPIFNNGLNSEDGEFIFAKLKNSSKNIYILNGRFYYYSGYGMRDIVHPVYVLKELGIKTIILIDEAGFLNPRFYVGSIAMVYDHINLMGDNPLIGENDNSIGTRFPDMSNAYDIDLYGKVENIFMENKFNCFPSVYLGVIGPETETEAECRFYREIGSDILGYGIVPENLAAIHCGIKSIAFGMISRELVADRLKEITKEEQRKNRITAEKYFSKMIKYIIL